MERRVGAFLLRVLRMKSLAVSDTCGLVGKSN